MQRIGPSVALALAVCSTLPAHARPISSRPQSRDHQQSEVVTRMRDQIHAVDVAALELYRSAPLRQAQKQIEAMFRADRNAANPEVARDIAMSAANIAFDAAILLANDDPHDPKVRWWQMRAHQWRGLTIPSGRWGAENPDNFYFLFPVDHQSDYEIVGQLPPNPPAAMTFSVYGAAIEEDLAAHSLGTLRMADLKPDANGRFVVTMGPRTAPGTPNHLDAKPGARWVMVRNSMTDWDAQAPGPIYVRRVAAGSVPLVRSLRQRAEAAAALAIATAKNWPLGHQHESYEGPPDNTMGPLMNSNQRVGGGLATQMSTHSSFALKPDEALIITAPTFRAPYYSIQLSNRWMTSIDYVHHNGSLNKAQSVANADDTVSWVISSHDPGVRNWADPDGRNTGSITIRFQDVPGGQPETKPMLGARVVKLADLRQYLPVGTSFVTLEQRATIARQRAHGYARRLYAILGPDARDLPN